MGIEIEYVISLKNIRKKPKALSYIEKLPIMMMT